MHYDRTITIDSLPPFLRGAVGAKDLNILQPLIRNGMDNAQKNVYTFLDGKWMHEPELADALNSQELMRIIVDSKKLHDRPSEFKSLADLGHKQYYVPVSWYRQRTDLVDTAGSKTTAELTPDEGAAIAGKRKRDATPKAKDSPEVVQFKKVKVKKIDSVSSLRMCKQKIDSVLDEMQNWEDKARAIVAKGYPEEMAIEKDLWRFRCTLRKIYPVDEMDIEKDLSRFSAGEMELWHIKKNLRDRAYMKQRRACVASGLGYDESCVQGQLFANRTVHRLEEAINTLSVKQ